MSQLPVSAPTNRYCDSTLLEKNWFHWVLASATPELEPFREHRLLWTRVGNTTTALPNPYDQHKEHCVALPTPFYCRSQTGISLLKWNTRDGKQFGTAQVQALLSLELDDPLLCLDLPYLQRGLVVPGLRENGYILEYPAASSWMSMISQVAAICSGVAKRFRPPSDEERDELTQEVLLQIMRKLNNGVLRYMPGKAPVFNLFTTTIYHCMYTIKSKSSKQRENSSKLAIKLTRGSLPQNYRSLRVPQVPHWSRPPM